MNVQSKDLPALFHRLFHKPLYASVSPPSYPHPWSAGAGCIKHCFTESSDDLRVAYQLFACYVQSRLQGKIPPPRTELAGIAHFLHIYWPCMSVGTQDAVLQVLIETHIQAMSARRICYRPEFAYITACKLSFKWAFPYRELLGQSRCGLKELKELYTRVPLDMFRDVFMGFAPWIKSNYVFGEPRFNDGGPTLMWEMSQYSFLDFEHTYEGISCIEAENLSWPVPFGVEYLQRMHSELGELVSEA